MFGGKRYIVQFAVVAALLVLVGCAGSKTAELRSSFVNFDEEQRSQYLAAKPGEYRIQEGDQLALIFSYLEDLNQLGIIVLPDGSVTIPGIDRVVVAGLTVSEVDSLITANFALRYRNPDMSVLVEETIGRKVYVLGEVQDPGLHTVPYGGSSILSAIGAAGGFTDDAKKSAAVLVRISEEGYLCQEIDLSRFHSIEGISYAGVGLESYDVIYLPRSKAGDFSYFTKRILSGVLDITKIASDVRYIKTGEYGR